MSDPRKGYCSNDEQYMTLSQCAHWLNLTRKALSDSVSNGTIPAIASVGGLRFSRKLIEQAQLSQQNKISVKAKENDVSSYGPGSLAYENK